MATRDGGGHARGLGWAAFWSGFVPGLLQYRAGQTQRAALALASCMVLFFAGYAFVADRLCYFALMAPEDGPTAFAKVLRTLGGFGVVLTLPELLNLPALVIGSISTWDGSFTGERLWRMPRDFEHIGGWLTGASGMLAAFWSADGHFTLRLRRDGTAATPRPVVAPALAAGLSWLVPGLGHVRAGQRDKGMLLGAAVLVVFGMGLVFSHGHAVDRANASVWWIGQNLCGGGTLFAALVTAPWQMTAAPMHLDLGIVLCTTAGLMNLVVMIDAFTVAERQALPVTRLEPTALAAPAAAVGSSVSAAPAPEVQP